MTTATSHTGPVRSAATQRRLHRGGAIVGAMALNAVLWGIASLLGADFVLTDSMGTGAVTLPMAVIFTAIFGLLGWGLLAVLERFTGRAIAIWTGVAVAVALLSIVPIFLEGASTATRVALTVLHLAVAAVLVPAFRLDRP
ncbi:MAG TPA: DUF6069 family protein [Pseudonocardia sp.]|jgi:hypothetical protein|nr:DUF6069 family protein [Pseudonocardia sp.]